MAIRFQLRRGNTAENDAFTGALGELTLDTQRKVIRFHDGVTKGGHIIPTNGWAVPDYSAGISLSGWGTATSNFSVPTDGVLQIVISSTSAVEEFFVDDKIVCALVNASNYTGWAVNFFSVSKGTHTWRTSSTPSRIYSVVFYPFKGVN